MNSFARTGQLRNAAESARYAETNIGRLAHKAVACGEIGNRAATKYLAAKFLAVLIFSPWQAKGFKAP